MKRAVAAVILSVFMLTICHAGTGVPGRYWTLVGPDDQVLLITGWRIYRGDRFIAGDDREYEVTAVRQYAATARLVGQLTPLEVRLQQTVPDGPDASRPIVVYHTHSHEAYVPTEGTDTIDEGGGIIDVGQALADELENQGVPVEHITTNHAPADSRAYNRSRRTAVKALRDLEPVALLDVHRDAAPARAYTEEIDGERVAQILIVVGRYNPSRSANARFARQVKRVVDERSPGLIKGIFFARGTYNQDLSPRALLLELGSHLVSREKAEAGAALFAQAAAEILHPGIQPEEDPAQAAEEQEELSRQSRLSAAGILSLVAIGGTAFTVINQPRIRPIVERATARGQARVARGIRQLDRVSAPARQRAGEFLRRAGESLRRAVRTARTRIRR